MKAEGSFEEVVMLMQLHLEQLEDNNKNKRRGGGGDCSHGASNPIAINCRKIAEICRKIEEMLWQPSLTVKEQYFWQGGSRFSLRRTSWSTRITIAGADAQHKYLSLLRQVLHNFHR